MYSLLKSVAPFNSINRDAFVVPPVAENVIFRKLVQNNQNGFILVDKNLHIVYKNAAAERIMGCKKDGLIPEGINTLVHQDDRRRIATLLIEIAGTTGMSKSCFFRTKATNGSFCRLDCTITNYISDPDFTAFIFDFKVVPTGKNEERLQLDEKKFRILVENSTDGITIFDKNRNLVYVSPAFHRILGYTEAEAYTLNGAEIIHPDDLPYTVSKLQESFNNPYSPIKNVIYRAKHKDGHYMVLNGTLTNLIDDPSIGGIVNNFRDITEKNKNEADLMESENKYKILFENSPLPLFFWECETRRIKDCNQAALVKYGYTREEFLNLAIEDLWPPDDNHVLVSDILKTLQLTRAFKIVRRHKKKNGDVIYVDINGQLINYNGEDMILTMCNDVTETLYYNELDKLEKNILERASQKQADLNEVLGDYLKGMETLHYGMFCSIFETRGNRLFTMAPSALPTNYVNEIDDIGIGLSKGPCGMAAFTKQRIICSNIQASDFSTKYKNIAAVNGLKSCWSHPIIDSDDNVMAVFACYYRFEKQPTDLELKTIERAAGILQVVLENKRWEQALLLSNTSLEKQAKELAISNDELEQFAYVASHDMQEPLRMITSFMTQLEKKYSDVVDETGKRYIHFAVDGAKRMRQIILDLLDFSRVGRVEESLEELDFNILMDELLELYSTQIVELDARVNFENLPVIKTYKTPIMQVFQNLIGNSLKYCRADEPPVITLSCKQAKNYYQFSIKDNGIGISPEYFEKIFVIFQRLHNKNSYSGTGMGLAITKKIIENLGGKIWVKSEEGKGSTFYFTILKNTK